MAEAAKHAEPILDVPLSCPLSVTLEFIILKPKTSKRDYPRGDVDNYEKAALDHITKNMSVWEDDDQVVRLSSHKRFAVTLETPGVMVTVGSA